LPPFETNGGFVRVVPPIFKGLRDLTDHEARSRVDSMGGGWFKG